MYGLHKMWQDITAQNWQVHRNTTKNNVTTTETAILHPNRKQNEKRGE